MPLPASGRLLAAAVAAVACALLAGCGGSVADADSPAPRADREPPRPSPFCAASQADAQAINQLNALISTEAPDRGELDRSITAVRTSGADLLAVAPPEVRGDVQLKVDAVEVQLNALAASGGDRSAVTGDPALTSRLSSPELAAASERLTGYVTRTCGASRR